MNERLTALKMRLNLKWEELAYKIGISVAMLGFLRRGERRPTTKILAAIAALETDTKTTTERMLRMTNHLLDDDRGMLRARVLDSSELIGIKHGTHGLAVLVKQTFLTSPFLLVHLCVFHHSLISPKKGMHALYQLTLTKASVNVHRHFALSFLVGW